MDLLKDARKKEWFWLENDLVDREDLGIYEKMIYIVLARYSDNESCCFPSYKKIALKCGCSERQAKSVVKILENKGLIKKENRIKSNSNEKESNIYFVLTAKLGGEYDAQQVVNMMHNPSAPHAQQVVHEVHSKKTYIKSNIYSPTEQEEKKINKDIHKRIIDYLNEKADKSFKSTTKKTISLINSRLAEGFVEEDFYKVIDNKVHAWLEDAKMSVYLRPETLFGNKFDLT